MNKNENIKDMIPDSLKAVFVIVIICLIAIVHTIGGMQRSRMTSIRTEIMGFLEATDTNSVVRVDGVISQNPEIIISTLKNINERTPHHSHPLDPFVILVENGANSLRLILARDSRNPAEYWIEAPDLSPSHYDDIGGIKTDIFDYKK